MRGNPINVTRKFYDVTFISRFVTSTLHLHKAQNVRACHYMINFSSAKTGQLVFEIFMFESVRIYKDFFSTLKSTYLEMDWSDPTGILNFSRFYAVLVTSKFDEDSIKNER